MIPERDWQGTRRIYLRLSDRRLGDRLGPLATDGSLDRTGVRVAWGQAEDDRLTWLAGIRQVPPGMRLEGWTDGEPRFVPAPLPAASSLGPALAGAMAGFDGRDVLVALSGGLDGALVLALWRQAGRPLPEAITLRTGLPGYDESERAAQVAAALGVRLHVAAVTGDDLVAALPDGIAVMEQPLFNLHPVARLLLARAAARLGARVLVTGDGADQAMRGQPAGDYLPLVAALTRAAGLEPWSPFLDPRVVAAALAAGPDPEKRGLRALAPTLGLPAWIADAPKRSMLAPALDLSPHLDRAAIDRLARTIDLPVVLDDDRARVGWVTLAIAHRLVGRA
jgi:asparagine synthase (glutamine-hydrolysing)